LSTQGFLNMASTGNLKPGILGVHEGGVQLGVKGPGNRKVHDGSGHMTVSLSFRQSTKEPVPVNGPTCVPSADLTWSSFPSTVPLSAFSQLIGHWWPNPRDSDACQCRGMVSGPLLVPSLGTFSELVWEAWSLDSVGPSPYPAS
jgi:hypothetical protein